MVSDLEFEHVGVMGEQNSIKHLLSSSSLSPQTPVEFIAWIYLFFAFLVFLISLSFKWHQVLYTVFHFLPIAAITDLVFHPVGFFVYRIINNFSQYSRLSRSHGLFLQFQEVFICSESHSHVQWMSKASSEHFNSFVKSDSSSNLTFHTHTSEKRLNMCAK